jgi:hypothetical protein
MGASLRLDHVVILVGDLAAAQAEYTAAGFTVVPGGAHEGSPTHNALLAFADGSYLELIARRPGTEGTPPGLARRLLRIEPDSGLVDFALLSTDLAATVQAARQRGLALGDPTAMGRTRPDGAQIAWELAFPPTLDLPFLIADTTPRSQRVPGGAATRHANGVTGIAQLVMAVATLPDSATRYRALLGDASHSLEAGAGEVDFALGGTIIRLTSAADQAPRGTRPVLLRLRADEGAPARALPAFMQIVPD